jgi:cytidyltransferase-like protein
MKSFLQLVEAKAENDKHVVMAFGRMNPPTTGHMKLVDKVHEVADKNKAKHVVVVSHSQDSKKNPLSAEQKVKHLKRYSPKTNFEAASKEHPTIMHHAAKLHKAGYTHLHVIAGSDRVKEYHDTLNRYNGQPDKKGHVPYHFKKITVHSAGHRDPDAEGTEGMSASKMREHAKNKDFHSFRQGIPSHVSDTHAKELMHDVRKGMGLHESVNHGQFKAIFVTGGPGSGKDIIIREAIAEGNAVELNSKQAFDLLNDKHRLSQKSNDLRLEAIRNRKPLIINGSADDHTRMIGLKEELEELGYETLIVFVDTTNEASQERNEKLTKMIAESVRLEKWQQAQASKQSYAQNFENFLLFDNSASLSEIEESITDTYQIINMFLENRTYNETAITWLQRHGRISINESFNILFEDKNDKKDSKSIQKQTISKYNPSFRAKSPADIGPDNRSGGNPPGQEDQIKGDTFPRKDPNGKGHSGGAWSGAYSTEETQPKITRKPASKESNFSQDKDKVKRKKFGDSSFRLGGVKATGVGPELDTRAGGQSNAAGAGLGQNLYGETQEFSNASQNGTAMVGAKVEPNPLQTTPPKSFSKFRKQLKEYNGFQNDAESGVGGVLGGADNKEGMDTYKDANRNIGITINKKKKKQEK